MHYKNLEHAAAKCYILKAGKQPHTGLNLLISKTGVINFTAFLEPILHSCWKCAQDIDRSTLFVQISIHLHSAMIQYMCI